jgi:hypothetical protein
MELSYCLYQEAVKKACGKRLHDWRTAVRLIRIVRICILRRLGCVATDTQSTIRFVNKGSIPNVIRTHARLGYRNI